MTKDELSILALQYDIQWQDYNQNIAKIDKLIAKCASKTDLIVLPEMFATGFCVDSHQIVQPEDNSPILNWMRKKAKSLNTAIAGSIAISIGKNAFNRLYFIRPDGTEEHYDKRHLFRLSDEPIHYTKGCERKTINYLGWKIRLNICYDLRFPIWMKNQYSEIGYEYDLSLIVANWPASRSTAWKTLTVARAIENQCFLIAVNRIGLDGNAINHQGDSILATPEGNKLIDAETTEGLFLTSIKRSDLQSLRRKFPVGLDWDQFKLC